MATAASPLDSLPLGKRELIVLLALLMSLNALAIDAMLPAIDDMAVDLGVGEGNQRQLIVGLYMIAMGAGCLMPGSLADRFGRRTIVLFSLAIYSIFSLITAFLTNFEVLLAARVITGIMAAGLFVAPVAIVRDLYEGDEMAQLMSLISAVFITIPVLAPSMGQAVLLVADWRYIFLLLAGAGTLAAVWVWFRLPETLAVENRQEVVLPVILRNMRLSLTNRAAVGYTFGAAILMGGTFGYVNSAQQLYQDHFGLGDLFPLVFGGTAAVLVISNVTNSRIVTIFGARRVSHAGVLAFIVGERGAGVVILCASGQYLLVRPADGDQPWSAGAGGRKFRLDRDATILANCRICILGTGVHSHVWRGDGWGHDRAVL